MATDWIHARRRYLYSSDDPDWLALPASTRALAAELLRWVDDDGSIRRRDGETSPQAIARMIQADAADRRWVERATTQLLADGHLQEAADRIAIKNFKLGQGLVETADQIAKRRAMEAEKKARQRASKQGRYPSVSPPVSPSCPPGTEGGHLGDIEGDAEGDMHSLAGARACAPARARPHASVPFLSVPEKTSSSPAPTTPPVTETRETDPIAQAFARCPDLVDHATELATKLRGLEMSVGRPRDVTLVEVATAAVDELGGRVGVVEPANYVLKICRSLLRPGALTERRVQAEQHSRPRLVVASSSASRDDRIIEEAASRPKKEVVY